MAGIRGGLFCFDADRPAFLIVPLRPRWQQRDELMNDEGRMTKAK